MKNNGKKLLKRCLLGAPIGLSLTVLITLCISLGIGDGRFYPVAPELIGDCGTELNAMLLQTACSFLYGAAWAGASLIWEQERWSLLRQAVLHLLVSSGATFPIAYFLRWMPRSISGMLAYFGTFLGIYAVIWIFQYAGIRRRLRQINGKIQKGPPSSL